MIGYVGHMLGWVLIWLRKLTTQHTIHSLFT